MSIAERVFGRLHRGVAAAVRWRDARPVPAHAATLAALAPRLRLLACALTGADVEVHAAADGGGVLGRRLALPATIALAPTAEDNRLLYVVRVAYAAASARVGFTLPAGAAAAERALFTLLAVPATRAAAEREMPALAALARTLAPFVLASRPDPSRLPPAEAALETLAQLHLGRDPDELVGCIPVDVLAWARVTARLAPVGTAELVAARERVCAPFGRGSLAGVVTWGTLLPAPEDPRVPAVAAGDAHSAAGASERPRPRRPEQVRVVDLGTSPIEENPAVHSFEKVHTAEEYRGGRKRVDAEDELAEHGEALDELDLREVVRSNQRTRSLYRADVLLEGGVGDLEGATPTADAIAYDEWDARHRRYRSGWCHVRAGRLEERRSLAEAARWRHETAMRHRAQIRALRVELARLAQARVWKGRQPDGPDVDVDAVVQRHADLASGHAPPDRLYCARRRHAHDLAILILLDASLSSDAWIAGRRVIDVTRDATLVIGEALAATPATVGVAAFASHTRRDCRFLGIKGFDEPWDGAVRRLASLEPAGYTRIGPALRHATAVLGRVPARRRLVLVVSDGKPTDYDRYEGRYGIADVRQAVREAEQRAVRVFALAVDGAARAHLPALFGRGNYALLPRPDALIGRLARAVAEVAR